MSSKKKKTASPQTQDVEQIREIIFGGQMRDYESRFQTLKKELLDTASDIRTDLQQRFDALGNSLKKTDDALSDRQKKERSERREGEQSLLEELNKLKADSQANFDHLEHLIESKTRELSDFHDSSQGDLDKRLTRQLDALKEHLDQQSEELRERKVSREELAGLLTEMALRLKGEFTLPEAADQE